jgi:hypothetical protein
LITVTRSWVNPMAQGRGIVQSQMLGIFCSAHSVSPWTQQFGSKNSTEEMDAIVSNMTGPYSGSGPCDILHTVVKRRKKTGRYVLGYGLAMAFTALRLVSGLLPYRRSFLRLCLGNWGETRILQYRTIGTISSAECRTSRPTAVIGTRSSRPPITSKGVIHWRFLTDESDCQIS